MASSASFADLVHLTDEQTQALLRRTDIEDMKRAIYGEDNITEQVRERLFRSMSEGVRNFIKEDLEAGDFKQEEIKEARQRLLKNL